MANRKFLTRHPRLLSFGVLLTLFSSFGQTFLISVFVPQILADFSLNSGQFGTLYAGATLCSAASLPFFGKLLDRSDLGRYTLAVGLALACSCWLLALAPNVPVLFLALLGLTAATAMARWGSVVEIHMLVALVRDAQGRPAEALQSLGDAFVAAPEPEAYVRLFLDEGEPMRRLLGEAHRLGVADAYPGRLLAGSEQPVRPQPLVDPLSERELQVLRLLDSELSGPDIARELFVSHNTVRTHTRHIFAKLQVTSRRAAVHQARAIGLL